MEASDHQWPGENQQHHHADAIGRPDQPLEPRHQQARGAELDLRQGEQAEHLHRRLQLRRQVLRGSRPGQKGVSVRREHARACVHDLLEGERAQPPEQDLLPQDAPRRPQPLRHGRLGPEPQDLRREAEGAHRPALRPHHQRGLPRHLRGSPGGGQRQEQGEPDDVLPLAAQEGQHLGVQPESEGCGDRLPLCHKIQQRRQLRLRGRRRQERAQSLRQQQRLLGHLQAPDGDLQPAQPRLLHRHQPRPQPQAIRFRPPKRPGLHLQLRLQRQLGGPRALPRQHQHGRQGTEETGAAGLLDLEAAADHHRRPFLIYWLPRSPLHSTNLSVNLLPSKSQTISYCPRRNI
mmetsp:Transcript_14436/g.24629  ORF Transcript_14436/g.24629 Transcript_14436/m.24629 type:complete len:347 (+) Transcript_14436:422-1462(+)